MYSVRTQVCMYKHVLAKGKIFRKDYYTSVDSMHGLIAIHVCIICICVSLTACFGHCKSTSWFNIF